MMRTILYLATAAFSLLASITLASPTEFERQVHDYIMGNPHVIQESLNQLRREKAYQQLQNQKESVRAAITEVRSPHAKTVLGNQHGELTLIEFFDYNCKMCRHSRKVIDQVKHDNPKLRIVFKLLPIFGQTSAYAALMEFYAAETGKYKRFRQQMYTSKTRPRQSIHYVDNAAKKAGIRLTPRAIQKIHSIGFTNKLKHNMELARRLGINGTPFFIIVPSHGKLTANAVEIVPGAAPVIVLQEAINRVKANMHPWPRPDVT